MEGIVYKITNTVNGMAYVGQTVQTLKARWAEHMSHARTGATKSYLASALKKYGFEAFTIKILNICLNREALDAVEVFYIKALNTKTPNGYNLADGGGGMSGWQNGKGHVPTEETRKKLSLSLIGNTRSRGYKHPEEFGKKISEALKKRVRKKESYDKMAQTRINGPKRPLTEKQKAANIAQRGKPWSEASRAAQKFRVK